MVTRRGVIGLGIGTVGAFGLGVTGFELVTHGVLPGQSVLDQLLGDCDVPATAFSFSGNGRTVSGTFASAARHTDVGWTIGFPPGYADGEKLPCVVMLHGFGGNHTNALSGLTPSQAASLVVNGQRLRRLAVVTVDGGGGYWNPHPGDDPTRMLIDELLPMCRRRGLGVGMRQVALMGISMGGFGAIFIAEQHPELFAAVAAISPAVWTTYTQAHAANPGAFSSSDAFDRDDIIANASKLEGVPVRIASGISDPFHAGVEALSSTLPSGATVNFAKGCHEGNFFDSQEPVSLAFLADHF